MQWDTNEKYSEKEIKLLIKILSKIIDNPNNKKFRLHFVCFPFCLFSFLFLFFQFGVQCTVNHQKVADNEVVDKDF